MNMNISAGHKNTKEIKSIAEMRDFASFVLNDLIKDKSGLNLNASNAATILALSGDLGSGKTTFTQQMVQIFGVTENVTSPTFILQKKYQISDEFTGRNFSQIIHMDMYRIENENELMGIGFDEVVKDPKNLIVIEWPEKIAGTLGTLSALEKLEKPCEIIWLNFEFVDETTRRVQW